MRVSQRLDYTLRGLVELASMPPGISVAAGGIADRLGLPRRFLEQQFTVMAKRGLLRCQRGAGGGCSLARSAEDISVGEVIRAVQGMVLDVPHTRASATSEMWTDVAQRIEAAVSAVTLAELARRQAQLDGAATAMYYI